MKPIDTAAETDGLPSPWHRLSTRIVISSLVALVVVLSMVSWTLWLSWQLEGAGAAINDTGSLRMRANRVAVELMRPQAGREFRTNEQVLLMDDTIARLARGNPARPLFIPNDEAIRRQWHDVAAYWYDVMKPAATRALQQPDAATYLETLPEFVARADTLVRMIEQDNAGKTTSLRLSQGVLAAIASAGTLAMIYLLYLWIISPVLRLRDGLQRMAAREFSTRLPVESKDEFGVLARGYNRMADELQDLYTGLERRVEEKTAQLAAQNRDIGALYDMAAFLNQPNEIEALCDGFLRRVMLQFDAEGGSIRALDPNNEKLNLMVAVGLSDELVESEHCMQVNDCYCGVATRQAGVIVIQDFRQSPPSMELNCQREGFASVAVFRIVTRDEVLGSYSLHFRQQRRLAPAESQLLETLGQHLGVALDNRRLSAQARQLAVERERGLVAQGLHDSLAQGLNFLNLQLQMLDAAVRRGDQAEIDEILPLLRTGVDESYQDVRELLTNFRTKLSQGDLQAAIEDTVARFRRQTGVETELRFGPGVGAPLPPDEQLQVLFILQEALSNVRKHSEASHVRIDVANDRDFTLVIADDGQGYDPAEVAERGESHVGLHIMRERAARMRAVIKLESQPGAGTRVALTLPGSERQAA
ncbi:type IV pili methyl-accepting chemotaxis transducer N-terminal domain-containing protein [Achromobacter insolitus]|uniref:type IV pili methyl-accepting chemotaxis transducer N-terminal domain-containing protein n=1 Tax=Achromobacter insolitus TaxID=217204 RepID=UPI0007C84886|nr:type IV pili methyl-accepting chemotaxis transducer N-terminal domain-containing protein [Achromobacter insolitus]OAE69806.1 histidine kinase [Achromobacter insolitus]OCZ62074.1 histidine kinase [Achromobacter insolitus]